MSRANISTSEAGDKAIVDISQIKSIESEAGIIGTILHKPEYTFYSEYLRPNHFSDEQNAFIYYAVCELAKRGIEKVDAYNITNLLNSKEATKEKTKVLTIPAINELITLSEPVVRESVEDYKLLVDIVLDKAFRRDTYKKLVECENLCLAEDIADIDQKIYSTLDDVMLEFSTTTEVPKYKDVVDGYWTEIRERQDSGYAGIPFKFSTLNEYVTIERGELVIFAAEAKQGKSMMLLNCAVDLLKKGQSVLYIDSELNSRLFTCRLIAHLARIEFSRVKSGQYSADEEKRINEAIGWLKTRKFTHIYLPMFDVQTMYTTVKKVAHTQGIDVLIVDYFKSKSEGDAFNSYQELGKLVDTVKNTMCGDMNIAGIGAAQATSTGKVADSAKIGRNASTIIVIQDKTPEEIEADGVACGNKKMRVVLNRNGAQMAPDEYIDMQFRGNLISYEEAQQHETPIPY